MKKIKIKRMFDVSLIILSNLTALFIVINIYVFDEIISMKIIKFILGFISTFGKVLFKNLSYLKIYLLKFKWRGINNEKINKNSDY